MYIDNFYHNFLEIMMCVNSFHVLPPQINVV